MQSAKLTVVTFDAQDVITTSGDDVFTYTAMNYHDTSGRSVVLSSVASTDGKFWMNDTDYLYVPENYVMAKIHKISNPQKTADGNYTKYTVDFTNTNEFSSNWTGDPYLTSSAELLEWLSQNVQ